MNNQYPGNARPQASGYQYGGGSPQYGAGSPQNLHPNRGRTPPRTAVSPGRRSPGRGKSPNPANAAALRKQLGELEKLAEMFGKVEQLSPRAGTPRGAGVGPLTTPLLGADPSAALERSGTNQSRGYEAPVEQQLSKTSKQSKGSNKSKRTNFWAKILSTPQLRSVAENTEVSLRGAFFVLLLSLPLMVDPGFFKHYNWNGVEWFLQKKFYQPETVLYIVYSLQRTVGETAYLIFCGLVGVGLCLLDVWLVSNYFPVQENGQPEFAWVLVNGVVFVAILLGLNFNINVSIYGCSFFCVYWMEFLRTPTDDNPAGGAIPYSEALKEMTSCIVGSVFCFLCVMLPYPLFALDQAHQTAEDLEKLLKTSWESLIAYYSQPGANCFKKTKIGKELQNVEAMLSKLEKLIANSWLECLFSSRWANSRLMMTQLHVVLSEAFDRLRCVQQYCETEKFEAQHMAMMDKIGNELTEVVTVSNELITTCIETILDGKLDDSERQDLGQKRDEVKLACSKLTQRFNNAKASVGLQNVSYELLEEHAFSFATCSYARLWTDLSSNIVDDLGADKRQKKCAPIVDVLCGVFDRNALMEHAHVCFMMRNWIALCLSMTFGYFGLQGLMSPFDAGIAMVCALLLNKSGGSAITKNFARIQGVVVGTVLGQMTHAVFVRCSWPNLFALSTVMFLVTAVSFFVYFNSKEYLFQYTGFMLATFSTLNMVAHPCSEEEFATKSDVFDKVVYVIFAMLIILIIDLAINHESAGHMAKKELDKAWGIIEKSVQEFVDPSCNTFFFPANEVRSHLTAAIALNGEAELEPRLWRAPWKGQLFRDAINSTCKARFFLTSLHHGVKSAGSNTGADAPRPKPSFLLDLTSQPGFKQVQMMLLKEIAVNKNLLGMFCHDVMETPMELSDDQLHKWSERLAMWEQTVKAHVKNEASGLTWRRPSQDEELGMQRSDFTLENDCSTRMSLVIVTLVAIMDSMTEFRRAAVAC